MTFCIPFPHCLSLVVVAVAVGLVNGPSAEWCKQRLKLSSLALGLALLDLCCHHVIQSGLASFRMNEDTVRGLWEAVVSSLLQSLWNYSQSSGGSWLRIMNRGSSGDKVEAQPRRVRPVCPLPRHLTEKMSMFLHVRILDLVLISPLIQRHVSQMILQNIFSILIKLSSILYPAAHFHM